MILDPHLHTVERLAPEAFIHGYHVAFFWGAVLLAFSGLAVLTLSGLSVGYGEALTFVAAVLYALHIVGLGAWSTPGDAMGMTIVQLAVITVICFVVTAPDVVLATVSSPVPCATPRR